MKLFHLLPKKSKFFSMSLALLASATLLTSCLKNDSDEGPGQPASGLSFVHAAASQPAIEILFDGSRFFNAAVLYGKFSPYYPIISGNHLVQSTIGGTTQRLTNQTITLEGGEYHTVFIANRGDTLTTIKTTDDLTAPTAGKAKVRFMPLNSGAEEYELYVQGASRLFQATSYGVSTQFVEINPAKYKFSVRLAGSAEDKAVTGEVEVKAGGFYTVVLAGNAATTGTSALNAFTVAQETRN